jgi:hypothetical protein
MYFSVLRLSFSFCISYYSCTLSKISAMLPRLSVEKSFHIHLHTYENILRIDKIVYNCVNMFNQKYWFWTNYIPYLAMNSGFSFNLNCSAVMDAAFMECAKELDIYKKIPGPNITFAVAAEILPPCVHLCYKH